MPTSNKTTYIRNGQPVNTDAYPLNKMVTWPGIKKYHEMLAYEIPRLGSNNRIGAIALYSFSLGQSNMVTGASVASFALGSGNTVIGSYSFIAGYGNTITGSSVTAFGRNLTLDATQNNERPLLMIGDGLNISDEAWKGKQVAFAIGGKEKDKDAKNLIIVTYDGKTVINGDLTVTGTLSNTGEGATIEGKADRTRNWLIGMKQAYLTDKTMGQHALWSIANEGLTKDDKSLDNHLLINYNHPDLTQAPKVIAFHRGPDEYADIYCRDCECAGLVGIKSGVIYSSKEVIQFRTGPASDAGYSDLYCKDVECSGVIGTEKGIIYNSNGKITFQKSPGNTTKIDLYCEHVNCNWVYCRAVQSQGKVEGLTGKFTGLLEASSFTGDHITVKNDIRSTMNLIKCCTNGGNQLIPIRASAYQLSTSVATENNSNTTSTSLKSTGSEKDVPLGVTIPANTLCYLCGTLKLVTSEGQRVADYYFAGMIETDEAFSMVPCICYATSSHVPSSPCTFYLRYFNPRTNEVKFGIENLKDTTTTFPGFIALGYGDFSMYFTSVRLIPLMPLKT